MILQPQIPVEQRSIQSPVSLLWQKWYCAFSKPIYCSAGVWVYFVERFSRKTGQIYLFHPQFVFKCWVMMYFWCNELWCIFCQMLCLSESRYIVFRIKLSCIICFRSIIKWFNRKQKQDKGQILFRNINNVQTLHHLLQYLKFLGQQPQHSLKKEVGFFRCFENLVCEQHTCCHTSK